MKRAIVMAIVLTACSSSAPPPPRTEDAVSKSQTDAASAPRMFSLEQLRQGSPQGRIVELRITVAGKPPVVEHWEFTKVDAESATIHSVTRDPDGKVIGDETGTSKWTELHDHGKFPADKTRIEDGVVITVPAGTFKARLYTVRADATTTRRFWFAAELPGPPVQFTTEKDGNVVMRAEMLRAR